MKRTGEVFRLGGCLKVPPISFEFLWLRSLGGGEALKRKRGDQVEFTTMEGLRVVLAGSSVGGLCCAMQ